MGDDVGRLDLAGRHARNFTFLKKTNTACLAAAHRTHLGYVLAIFLE